MIISKFTSRTNQNEPPKVIGGGPWGGLTPCPEGGGAMGSMGAVLGETAPDQCTSTPSWACTFGGWPMAQGPWPMAHAGLEAGTPARGRYTREKARRG